MKTNWKELLEHSAMGDKAERIADALESAGINTVYKLYNATGIVGAKVCGVDTVLVVSAILTAIASGAGEAPAPKPKRKKLAKKKKPSVDTGFTSGESILDEGGAGSDESA